MTKKDKPAPKKRKNHRHQWVPDSYESFQSCASDKVRCKKCRLTKTCEHGYGKFSINRNGFRYCKRCGLLLGICA